MKLDLSLDLQKGAFEKDVTLPFDITTVQVSGDMRPVSGPEEVSFHVESDGSRLCVTGEAETVVTYPCDRCLKDTKVPLTAEVSLEFPLSDGRIVLNPEDPETYVENGNTIDLSAVLSEEILIGKPEKVLCKPDCKGLCPVCGQDLNEGTCNCEKTVPDPRMQQFQDVFKNFKEVE
ncbi:MAG: DUF177 domain-containing protein [Lachnospiraceae bacterium]|nr:DUF177 domain-containing protein [Lachnospiraceae bacterium]